MGLKGTGRVTAELPGRNASTVGHESHPGGKRGAGAAVVASQVRSAIFNGRCRRLSPPEPPRSCGTGGKRQISPHYVHAIHLAQAMAPVGSTRVDAGRVDRAVAKDAEDV